MRYIEFNEKTLRAIIWIGLASFSILSIVHYFIHRSDKLDIGCWKCTTGVIIFVVMMIIIVAAVLILVGILLFTDDIEFSFEIPIPFTSFKNTEDLTDDPDWKEFLEWKSERDKQDQEVIEAIKNLH